MRIAAAALRFLLIALPLRAQLKDRQPCPEGWTRVPTRDHPDEPFHCLRQMDPGTPFIEMKANSKLAHCPKGFSPIATPGELQRYRCVKDAPRPTGVPDVAPALTRKESPEARQDGGRQPAVLEYTQHQMQGIMLFDYPKDWHLTDGWQDEVPTVYIEYDTGRQGQQPTLVITKYAQGQEGWVDMDTAIAQEKEYQNSKELARTRVGGLPARVTALAQQSRSAYVDAGKLEYYLLTYTASEELFPVYEPAFKRLLSSFRFSSARRAQERR